MIALTMVTFFVDYVIELGESVNQLCRGLIIASYSIVGLVYIFFSVRLLKEMQSNLHGRYALKSARRVSGTEKFIGVT